MRNLTLPGAGEASAQRDAAAAFPHLPSIDRLLGDPALVLLSERYGQALVKRAAQEEVESLRKQWRADSPGRESTAGAAERPPLLTAIERRVHRLASSRLPTVFNLTGTVIHTNLGRALLPDEAIEAVAAAMRGFVALEYDVDGGGRGDRDVVVEELLCDLTGAEAATVVNNCAA